MSAASAVDALRIVTDAVAEVGIHVFIPVDETVNRIRELLKDVNIVFVRAGVASGKSTLVRFMVDNLKDEFLEVEPQDSDNGWCCKIINAGGGDYTTVHFDDRPLAAEEAMKRIGREGKTIVIDEAHNLFSHPFATNLVVNKPRDWRELERPKILLISAASTGKRDNALINTPKEIRKKVMWYPPLPNVDDLADQLKRANVYLSGDSVRFFLQFCAGRRGVFMQAIRWVQSRQKGTDKKWEYKDTVSQVRASLEESRTGRGWRQNGSMLSYLRESRAVRVNIDYSEIKNIPDEFAGLLFEGPKRATELNHQQRPLTIAGFLVPERQHGQEEFIICDWTDGETPYGISNPIMAMYYREAFENVGCELIPEKQIPTSAADLVARFLPYLSFAAVVDNSVPGVDGNLQSSLNSQSKPYEENYNNAITTVLTRLKYTTANPLNRNRKTDIVVIMREENFVALESVLATQTEKRIQEHASRFYKSDQPNYSKARFKGLLVIDGDPAIVQQGMSYAQKYIQEQVSRGKSQVEIIGLVHSSTFDGYTMLLEAEGGGIFFACDQVAKSLVGQQEKNASYVTAQKRKHSEFELSHSALL